MLTPPTPRPTSTDDAASPLRRERERLTDGRGALLLIVDDDPDTLVVLALLLAREGYRIATAATGHAALALARDAPPALVLLDVRLPDLPGPEVCRRLHADPATRHVPIVFVTGSPHDVTPAQLDGCDPAAVLVKPVALEDLIDAVRRLIPA